LEEPDAAGQLPVAQHDPHVEHRQVGRASSPVSSYTGASPPPACSTSCSRVFGVQRVGIVVVEPFAQRAPDQQKRFVAPPSR
jgi:hypothetical protein